MSAVIPLSPVMANDSPLSANERVYREIKQLILVGRLMPGVQLTHEALAAELGVSRTPIREGLERLLQEGFVVHRRNRGYFVADLSAEEVRELFGLRAALELYALQESWRRESLDSLEDLHSINERYREAINEGASKQRMLIDQEFHLALATRSGNEILVRTLHTVFERIILKRRVSGYVTEQGLRAYQEQAELLDLLASGQQDMAHEALRQHIASGCNRLLMQMREYGES